MAFSFNVDLLYALYQKDALKSKNSDGLIEKDGFDDSVFQVSGDKVTVMEADGDVFTYNISELTNEKASALLGAQKPLGAEETNGTEGIQGTEGTQGTDGTSLRSRKEIEDELAEVRIKISELKDKIKENTEKITALEQDLEQIYDSIEKTISEYIDKAEDIEEEIKEEVKQLTLAEIEKYKNGEYKTKEELHDAIEAGVENLLSSSALAGLMNELEGILNEKKSEADAINSQISELTAENEKLGAEVDTLQIKENALVQELATVAAKEEEEAKKCEPQGFSVKNEDGSITQYDFFVDRDNNGQLSDTSEFLGAQGYEAGGKEGAWDEMVTLDTDGDGFVTTDELELGNVKVVMTTVDKDGNKTQKVVDASEAFGSDEGFKISTKQNSEKSESDTPLGFNDSKYAGQNELLGNFNVSFNGQDYTGYQTADSVYYLKENYTFNDESKLDKEKTILDAGLLTTTGEFKYDIQKIMQSFNKSVKGDLMEYAEDICAQNGIIFGHEDEATQDTKETPSAYETPETPPAEDVGAEETTPVAGDETAAETPPETTEPVNITAQNNLKYLLEEENILNIAA